MIVMKLWKVTNLTFVIISTEFNMYRIVSGSIIAFNVNGRNYNLNIEKLSNDGLC